MPKAAQDLRIHGISFDDALKRMIASPPPPSSKKAKQKKATAKRNRSKPA